MSLNTSIGPKVVPPTPPSALASYDFVDIADGTGVVNFYLCQSIASGAIVDNFLTTDATMISAKVVEKTENDTGEITDINYDTTFNLPKIIKGKVRMNFSVGANVEGTINLAISLYKVSGGTPVQIGDTVSTVIFNHSGAGRESVQRNVFIDTGGRVHFKIGDILRLKVIQNGAIGGSPSAAGYGVDPAGRDDFVEDSIAIVIEAGETTQFKVAIPFVIDI